MKKNIDEVNRSFYDFKNKDDYQYKIKKGLTKDIVLEISKMKNDPEWMKEIRLKGLEAYEKLDLPSWGPDLSELDMDDISTYVRPKGNMSNSWEEVPEDIKDTFERLGIPESERLSLAGVGAQYDSEVVYHSMKEELSSIGVVYTDMESAVRDYPDIVKEYLVIITGDVTKSGNVGNGDVNLLFRYLRNKESLNECQLKAADTTSDNEIHINDVAKIYQFIHLKIDRLGE